MRVRVHVPDSVRLCVGLCISIWHDAFPQALFVYLLGLSGIDSKSVKAVAASLSFVWKGVRRHER